MAEPVVMTAEALAALKAELEELETEGRREIAERIKVAREWGDLKENSEYHDAKNDQARLETKILQLREKLLNAKVVEASAGGDAVGLGSRVSLRDEGSGREIEYTLVSSVEADAASGRLSYDSPVARALLGARVGDVVSVGTPRGERRLRVVALG